MIIDIHVHMGHHPLMDFKQTPQDILTTMEKFGIDHTFVWPFPSMKIRIVNETMGRVIKKYPNKLVGLANIDPSAENATTEVEHAASLGLKGIMLDPEFHRVFGRDLEKVEQILVHCIDHGFPVFFNTPNIETADHASYLIGGTSEPYSSGLRILVTKFPQVKFIVNTHWPRIRELMKYPNIFIDTGGRNGASGAIGLAQDVGPTRICFGSESPQKHPGLGIKAIQTMKLSLIYREMILGKNAERIFKDIF